MKIEFAKYHGAGNDFIMTDCRKTDDSVFSEKLVKSLCNRNFGIGADGLILLMNDENADFRMKYFNSDGKEGTMCGNGGRCITAYAKKLGLVNKKAVFSGIDGLHEAVIKSPQTIDLKMIDVHSVRKLSDGYLLNTGSTHFVLFCNNIDKLNVYEKGKEIRSQSRFGKEGTNVNFVEILDKGHMKIRTFERGVENETLACGTGAVASAISSYIHTNTDNTAYKVYVHGGTLEVRFEEKRDLSFENIWLSGPAEFVFEGIIQI